MFLLKQPADFQTSKLNWKILVLPIFRVQIFGEP